MSQTFTNKIFKIYEKHGNLEGFKQEYIRLVDMLKTNKTDNKTDNNENKTNNKNDNKTDNIDNKTDNSTNNEKQKDIKKSQTLKLWVEAAVELTGKKIIRKDDKDYDKVKELYLQKKQKLENKN